MIAYIRFDRFFPHILPPVITLLIFLFLCSLTIRAGIRKKENRLFTLFCIIQILMLINMVGCFALRSSALVIVWSRITHLIYVFAIPTSIHYIHYALGLRKGKTWVRLIYGLSIIAALFTQSRFYYSETIKTAYGLFPKAGPMAIFFAGLAVVFLVVYTGIVLLTLRSAIRDRNTILLRKSAFILAGFIPTLLLTMANCLTLMGVDIYPMGGFGFIPMSVFTYGVLRHEILDNRGWFSISHIPNFLTALVWIPLILSMVFCGLFSETILQVNVMERLMTWALPAVFSFLVCFVMATFCFQNSNRQIETVIFGAICALWGFLSLDIGLLMVIKDTDVALQISRIDHFFLVMQLGLYIHFLHYFVGIRKIWVYVCYGVSLMIAPITQTGIYLTGIKAYSWGLFAIKGPGFDLFTLAGLLEIMCGCIVLVREMRMAKDDASRKRYFFFIAGACSVVFLELSNIPAMSGLNIYPFGSFMFLPVLLTAYGVFRHHIVQINVYSRRRITGGIVRMLIYGGYALLPFMVLYAISSLTTDYLLSRILYSGMPSLISFLGLLFLTGIAQRMGQIQVGARLFGLICQIYAMLTLVMLFNSFMTDMDKALSLSRFYHIVVVFLPALQLHLVGMICNQKASWPIKLGLYLGGMLLVCVIPFNSFLSGMHTYSWGVMATAGPAFGFFVILVVVSSLLCFQAFFKAAGRAFYPRSQRDMLFFSLVFGVALGMMSMNTAAMYGIDIYPAGNFIIIPLGLFGYAMFRQNFREALNVLNTMIYWAGMMLFFALTALFLSELSPLNLSGSLFFVGIIIWGGCYKIIDRGLTAILSLFLVRQREVLEELFSELPDVLSRVHTQMDIFESLADPVFNDLKSSRFALCFKADEGDWFVGWERLNPQDVFFVGEGHRSDKAVPMTLTVQNRILDSCGNQGGLLDRERIEEVLIIQGINLPQDHPLKSVEIICPVLFEEKRVAVMLFYSKIDGTIYSEDEKTFISRSGFILGSYIENARLLQGLEDQVDARTRELSDAVQDISHMNRVIRTISSTLDIDEVMAAFSSSLADRFRYDRVAIVLKRSVDERFYLYRVHGRSLSDRSRQRFSSFADTVSEGVSEFVGGQLTTDPIFISDYSPGQGYGAVLDGLCEIEPFASLLIFPLELKGTLAGAVIFTSVSEPFQISEHDIDILHQHTNQLAIAIYNAILYEKSETATRAKSEFLARMSHEIRTPLNAIMAMGDLLTHTPLSPDQAEYLNIFTSAGDHLLSVVNDILDFSQIEADQTHLVLVPFDLSLRIRRVMSVMTALAREKGLNLEAEGVDEPLWVMGDTTKLSQVLINLIGNGIKFTNIGGVRLRVQRHDGDDGRVTFSVIDTGVGIPESQQPGVFEQFMQIDPTGAGRLKGTGLGLAISSRFVEIMGGHLMLHSQEDVGSTFTFTIPLAPVPDQERERLSGGMDDTGPLPSYDHDAHASGDSEPLRILLAEDIETNRLVITHYLSSFHVHIDSVGDGLSAVEWFKSQPYDLVLMDVELPELNGFEAVASIRAWEAEKNVNPVPIIVLSAHALSGYHDPSFPQGVQAFLSKPFKREHLLRTLSQWVVIPLSPKHGAGDDLDPSPVFRADPDLNLVIPELFKEIRGEMAALRHALHVGDMGTLKRLAHGFKGASANCGVEPLIDYFRCLHDVASQGRIGDASDILTTIGTYLDTVNVVYERQ